MRISVDVREACREGKTGKGQWTYGFVSELLTRVPTTRLFTDAPLPDAWKGADAWDPGRRGIRWHVAAASELKKDPRGVYVSTTSYIVPALVGRGVRTVPVVHDLIAFRGEPHDRKATAIEALTLGRTVGNAAHVCAVSQSTKDDLLAKYPSLSPSSVTPIFAGPMGADVPQSQPDGKTILCVATLSPRKNQLRLIQAYSLLPDTLRSRCRLVLVGGRGWHDGDIVRLARSTPGVEWKGYVTDAEYASLLSTCTVFALPSLYEGFGMQILDALQRGIPVLTSDRGGLQEVTGDAAVKVDPASVPSISHGLEMLLSDPSVAQTLRQRAPIQAATFSWKRTVDLFLEAMDGLQDV